MTSSRRIWKPVAVAAAVAIVVGFVGGMLTDTGPWYQALKKPSWQPPDWLFGPAWTVIFGFAVASAVSAWRHARDRAERDLVIILFAINGCFNVLWSTLFFALKRPDWALIEVGCLWLAILVPIVAFWRVSRLASYLLLPYLAWVSFAAYLNFTVVRLNASFG